MPEEPNIATSELIDEHDVEANAGINDGYSTALYKSSEGRHYIYIVHSDMSSKYDGALGFHQWVAVNDVNNWKEL